MEIQLTGWKAVAAIVIVVIAALWGVASRNATLDTEAKDVVKTWVSAEYTRKALAKNFPDGKIPDDPELAQENIDELLAAGKISIPSIKARGGSGSLVVRVEVLVDGKTPPDGKSVRYYRMNHSHITGWTMDRESNKFMYYLALF